MSSDARPLRRTGIRAFEEVSIKHSGSLTPRLGAANPRIKLTLVLPTFFYPKLNVVISGNFQGAGTIVRIAANQFEHGEEDFFAMLARV
jgi:hypothetical protein